MADIDRDDTRVNIVLMVIGGALGVLCVVLLLVGIGTPGLWFTAAGMVLLVLSQWMTIRSKRRRR
ncbi:hypothetical protein [Microbacterium sp. 2RAF4]|uniref:hypothetical protein n=1 Tax=Microbacterium sp. 2RAF4 TaxID=3232999 RepID=UPI003F9E254A